MKKVLPPRNYEDPAELLGKFQTPESRHCEAYRCKSRIKMFVAGKPKQTKKSNNTK